MRTPAHVYIPNELSDKILPLYSTENIPDPTVHVKLFTPDSSFTWYLLEASALMKDGTYQPINGAPDHIAFVGESDEIADVTCFGLVVGHETELGYWSLADIVKVRGPLGLRVERDLFFTPRPLSEVRALHECP